MSTPPPIPVLPVRLARADAAWRREQARVLVWRAAPWFIAAAFAAGALDAFLQLGLSARLALLGAGVVAALIVLAAAAAKAWWQRNPPERIARHLEVRAPALGSRLINALQLTAQAGDPALPVLTRELAGQAAARSAEEFATTDLPGLARTGADRRALERGLLVLAGAAVLALVFYPVSTMVVPRFLDPFGDHPPYAFTQVEIAQPFADGAPVIYGGTLAVRASWSGHEPRELFLTAHPPEHPEEAVTVPMVRDVKKGFIAAVGDVRTNLILVAHARNRAYYSPQRLARVVLTPRLEQGWVEIVPPAYTALRTEERKLDFKTVGALEGSTLRFRLRSNRPLREGVLDVRREGAAEAEPEQVKLALHGTHEVQGELPATTDARLRFRVTDVDGLVSEFSPETFLTLAHDLPPTIEVREPAQDGFASVAFVLPAKFEASDDYGVRTLRIHRALNGAYTAPLTIEIEGVHRDATYTHAFDFLGLGARPGDRVSFFAEAIDTAPSPHLSRSRTVTMTLISEEEYNDHLREVADIADLSQKYTALADRFEALRNEQVALAAEAKAAADRLAKEGANPSAEAQAKVAALAARQDALDAELEKLADQLRDVVRPKPVYDFERDLAERLAAEARALRASARQSRAERDAAAEAGGNPAAALEHRAREQAERLGARREQLAKDMERPLRDLSKLHDLVNDVNLFEQAYLAQEALAEQMRSYAAKPAPSREDQLAMKDLAARQAGVREVLRQLPDRLRAHSDAVEKEFPKSAAGGRALAAAIEKGRLGATAESATERLLQADGRNGAALGQRLADDMRALMAQCQSGEGQSDQELDQYLQAKMPQGGGAGQTWQQMRQSRKFTLKGGGLTGTAPSSGQGGGMASGYSMAGNNPPPVFGAEPAPAAAPGAQKSGSKAGMGSGEGTGPGGGTAVQTGHAEVLKGLNPADRESAATPGELGAEEYRELVDEYFKQLTRP